MKIIESFEHKEKSIIFKKCIDNKQEKPYILAILMFFVLNIFRLRRYEDSVTKQNIIKQD